VSNIGFCSDATHTFSVSNPLANLKTEKALFPLIHPGYVYCNSKADSILYKKVFGIKFPDRARKIWRDFKALIKKTQTGQRLALWLRSKNN
jgi:hypothetical protein